MRKMTYTQAATCGEKLKVQVTPEQSEKMQRAWFAAGKRWCGGSNRVAHVTFKFLWLSNDLMIGNNAEHFILDKDEEIELIDGLHPADFASQLEVIAWFVVGEKAIHTENRVVAGFKDGVLWDFTLDRKCILNFFDFERWKRYTPPRSIEVNGVVAPAPLESLEGLAVVYVADVTDKNKFFKLDTDCEPNKDILNYWLNLGLLYTTKEDAIKRTEAMVKFEVVEC